MTDTLPKIRQFIESSKLEFEVMDCNPELADTYIFCKEYGIDLEDSVNTIVVKTKTGELKYAVCALLATTKLDINNMIRKKLGARKVSFATIEETAKLTEMDIGGVTPLTLPRTLPLWVDSRVMQRNSIVLGGGNRSSKIKISPKIFQQTLNTEIVEGLAN
jgi:prolyl-tRNA editing enzyme YbaK/EbsC (Cys-tRNA(Pro) deacylase)